LRGRTVSEKLPKIPLFGPSLIRPQSKVLLTSFSTWERENSLAKINLESTGVIRGCNIFGGQKLANAAVWAGAFRATRKKSREQNAAGRTR